MDYIDYEPRFSPVPGVREPRVFEYRALRGKNVPLMKTPFKRSLLALWTAIALFTGACTSGEEPSSEGPAGQQQEGEGEQPQEEDPRAASFEMGEIKAIDSKDRPESGPKATEHDDRVRALVNGYYTVAFMDPAKWAEGTHPELANFFTEEAKGQVGPRLGVLALADLSDDLTSVRPVRQVIDRLNYYFDEDLNNPIGMVTTTFEATGTPSAEGADPIKIVHHATFWLEKVGDDFRISAFDANIDVQSQGAA